MVRVGKLKIFQISKNDRNSHGTQKRGERWNKETVCGPKFKVVKLEGCVGKTIMTLPGFHRRVIFYSPSGTWWHLDLHWDSRKNNG